MSAPPGLLAGRQGLRGEETGTSELGSCATSAPLGLWVTTRMGTACWPALARGTSERCQASKIWRCLTDLSFSKPVTASAALSGPPVDNQGSALCAEDTSPWDRILHVCVNEQLLLIKEKLATVSVHIPAELILCFKVTVIHVLALNCQRHC